MKQEISHCTVRCIMKLSVVHRKAVEFTLYEQTGPKLKMII